MESVGGQPDSSISGTDYFCSRIPGNMEKYAPDGNIRESDKGFGGWQRV